MSDIFVSYSNEDRGRARVLVSALEERGWSVWWDRDLPVGAVYDQAIQAAINDARCVIVLWSRSSVESQWVRDEADEGRRRQILVPVLIDPVDLPIGFRRIQTADFSKWSGDARDPMFGRLVGDVAQILGEKKQAEERPVERGPGSLRVTFAYATLIALVAYLIGGAFFFLGNPERISETGSIVAVIGGLAPLIIIWVGLRGRRQFGKSVPFRSDALSAHLATRPPALGGIWTCLVVGAAILTFNEPTAEQGGGDAPEDDKVATAEPDTLTDDSGVTPPPPPPPPPAAAPSNGTLLVPTPLTAGGSPASGLRVYVDGQAGRWDVGDTIRLPAGRYEIQLCRDDGEDASGNARRLASETRSVTIDSGEAKRAPVETVERKMGTCPSF